MATSGPGAIHLLNGLYDAKLDHVPVVAIVGQRRAPRWAARYQQEVDLPRLFKDVASEYVQVCMVPEQPPHLIDRAMRIAKATRSSTCVIVPNDIQESEYSAPPRAFRRCRPGVGSSSRSTPRPAMTICAARPTCSTPASGWRCWSGRALAAPSGRSPRSPSCSAPASAKALIGTAVLPDDLPFVTGSIGLLGTKPTDEMMEGCDTLLMVGSSFPYSEWLPEFGQARGVQIDIDARLSACAIRWSSTWSATAPRRCAR